MIIHLSLLLRVLVALSEAQSTTANNPSETAGSCHSFTSCCDPAMYTSCRGDPPDCYCDQICYQFNDCCNDISSAGNCLATSNEPSTGSCENVGFDGCCNPNIHVTCKGDDNICFCDQVCFQYGDCCSDIHEIGCYISASSPASTPTEGSCAAAGFSSCCNPGDSTNCYGNPPTCYCDEVCFKFDDCCSDIGQICSIESPTVDHGRCSGLGFNDGCCVPGQNQNCHGSDGICYCDEICYNYGDCCEDIEEINCFKVQATPGQGSCIQKGFQGCCDPNLSSECYGSAGTSCYCDELCYQFNDCCFDVDQIGCLEPTGTPQPITGSCLLAGHYTCCTVSVFEPCYGSDGICRCDDKCYDYGDCCVDIGLLQCSTPTSPTDEGSCKAAGFTECCHPYNQEGKSCYGDPQTCYCDSLCFSFGDCCNDAKSIGCVEPSVIPSVGSCAAAGYKTCCEPSSTEKCLGHPESCHCDVECHKYGDCCPDIIDIGCFSGSCLAANRTSCCLSDDPECTGSPANCMCDQACYSRGDCCNDIGNLEGCGIDPNKLPGIVNNLLVNSVDDNSLLVTWDPPGNTNGANAYVVKVTDTTKSGNDNTNTFVTLISIRRKVVQGLSPYIPYSVSVSAINEFGEGKAAMGINFTKEGVPKVAPHNITVVRSDKNAITVTWIPLSLTEARGFITKYKISYSSLCRRRRRGTESSITVSGDSTQATITNLDARKKYGVKVAGITKGGTGPNSDIKYESVYGVKVAGISAGGIGPYSSVIYESVHCSYGQVRLSGGRVQSEGRVEICTGSRWSTVCGSQWTDSNTQVVCRQLGYPVKNVQTFLPPHFQSGCGPIYFSNVHCYGDEVSLLACFHKNGSAVGCGHDEDIGVACEFNQTGSSTAPWSPLSSTEPTYTTKATSSMTVLTSSPGPRQTTKAIDDSTTVLTSLPEPVCSASSSIIVSNSAQVQENTVIAVIGDYSVFAFTTTAQDVFEKITKDSVQNYCSIYTSVCSLTNSLSIDTVCVIISHVEAKSGGSIEVSFYLTKVNAIDFIPVQAVIDALEASKSNGDYEKAGFRQISFSPKVPKTPDNNGSIKSSKLSGEYIAIIGLGCSLLVVMAILITIIFTFIIRKKKSSKKYSVLREHTLMNPDIDVTFEEFASGENGGVATSETEQ